jgi:hypothetical protein
VHGDGQGAQADQQEAEGDQGAEDGGGQGHRWRAAGDDVVVGVGVEHGGQRQCADAGGRRGDGPPQPPRVEAAARVQRQDDGGEREQGRDVRAARHGGHGGGARPVAVGGGPVAAVRGEAELPGAGSTDEQEQPAERVAGAQHGQYRAGRRPGHQRRAHQDDFGDGLLLTGDGWQRGPRPSGERHRDDTAQHDRPHDHAHSHTPFSGRRRTDDSVPAPPSRWRRAGRAGCGSPPGSATDLSLSDWGRPARQPPCGAAVAVRCRWRGGTSRTPSTRRGLPGGRGDTVRPVGGVGRGAGVPVVSAGCPGGTGRAAQAVGQPGAAPW